MDVRGSHPAAAGGSEKSSDRTVRWDRVGDRAHRPEAKATVAIREQMPTVRGSGTVVLDDVQAVAVRFPHVDPGTHDRFATDAADPALDPARLTDSARREVAAEFDLGGVLDEERAEHSG